VEQVLVESGKDEGAVLPNGPADGQPELVLPVRRLEVQKAVPRVHPAVAQVVERSAVPVVRARLGDHIDHRTAGPS